MNPFASIKHLADQVAHHKRKHQDLLGKVEGATATAVRTLELGAGAFLGGALEGKTQQGKFLHVPINLLGGVAAIGAGMLDLAGDWSPHLATLGEGMVASYASSVGYAFGQRWQAGGLRAAFGGGAPVPLPPPPVAIPAPPPAHMAGIVGGM